MNKTMKYALMLLPALFIAHIGHSQTKKERTKLMPKVKRTIDSLYPKASNINLKYSLSSDTTQQVYMHCNCPETTDMMVLVLDTNGILLSKELHYHTLKELPDTLVRYIKKNTSSTTKFYDNYMTKCIRSNGEIIYGIMVIENPNPTTRGSYLLRFKSSGEFVSKEKQDTER
jgi:hypothetical protein